jgi:methionine-rich copper-binding protein CopC
MKRTILSLISLATLLVPVNANAHAGLVSANPAANSSVTMMPTEIALTFTEDLMVIGDKKVNSISLNLLDGAEIALTDLKVDGSVLSASVPAGEYDSGLYEVFYSIVSADGHKLSDSYSFTLKSFGSTLQTASPTATPSPTQESGDGVLPLPIVGAITLVVILGGFFALRARNRKR